jgi:hypothetical protein
VLRLFEVGGDVMGELVDPLSQRRQRFIGRASLADALQAWVDDNVSSTGSGSSGRPETPSRSPTRPVCRRAHQISEISRTTEDEMANISWVVNVQVDGRVAMSASTPAETAEAIESLQVTIAPGDTDKVVDLMPGAGSSVKLVVIKSSRYGEDLRFKASDGAADSDPVTLAAPQVYTAGSVALFGLNPNKLKFTNTSTTKGAEVAIFVARDATP